LPGFDAAFWRGAVFMRGKPRIELAVCVVGGGFGAL